MRKYGQLLRAGAINRVDYFLKPGISGLSPFILPPVLGLVLPHGVY